MTVKAFPLMRIDLFLWLLFILRMLQFPVFCWRLRLNRLFVLHTELNVEAKFQQPLRSNERYSLHEFKGSSL